MIKQKLINQIDELLEQNRFTPSDDAFDNSRYLYILRGDLRNTIDYSLLDSTIKQYGTYENSDFQQCYLVFLTKREALEFKNNYDKYFNNLQIVHADVAALDRYRHKLLKIDYNGIPLTITTAIFEKEHRRVVFSVKELQIIYNNLSDILDGKYREHLFE